MTALAGLVAPAMDRLGAVWVAAQPGDYDPSSGHGPEWGKAAPAGLLIWLFLGTALFFLIKSMNRNMRRVPKSFDGDGAAESAAGMTTSRGRARAGGAGAATASAGSAGSDAGEAPGEADDVGPVGNGSDDTAAEAEPAGDEMDAASYGDAR